MVGPVLPTLPSVDRFSRFSDLLCRPDPRSEDAKSFSEPGEEEEEERGAQEKRYRRRRKRGELRGGKEGGETDLKKCTRDGVVTGWQLLVQLTAKQ